MSRTVEFTDEAWETYLFWQRQDKKTLKRINELIKDIKRDPFNGIGRPEALVSNLAGCLSRRIDEKNRLIYKVSDQRISIISCRYHYGDK
ncbi:Txe/YoeB family addiction module toxin [Acinetobacter venetianus]|uniref:Txe/YoeB family addiction module toxin n=1 Tax=Acinetobacter venetianus TaxID=52133 RepID=UPI003A90DD9D